MTKDQLLGILKIAIGEPNATADRLSFITFCLDNAIERLAENGIETSAPYSQSDAGLIIPYAEFLIEKRETSEGLPRYLEWAMHNRIVKDVSERV